MVISLFHHLCLVFSPVHATSDLEYYPTTAPRKVLYLEDSRDQCFMPQATNVYVAHPNISITEGPLQDQRTLHGPTSPICAPCLSADMVADPTGPREGLSLALGDETGLNSALGDAVGLWWGLLGLTKLFGSFSSADS